MGLAVCAMPLKEGNAGDQQKATRTAAYANNCQGNERRNERKKGKEEEKGGCINYVDKQYPLSDEYSSRGLQHRRSGPGVWTGEDEATVVDKEEQTDGG
uniref:Uncharacterized protein n=1 Tax=Steinernema glaseri TaxID=37863 RepID=A0A1I7YFY6_9BILA